MGKSREFKRNKFITSNKYKESVRLNEQFWKGQKNVVYRCRSAYKLLEIDQKYKIFKNNQTVVDLGCAPGSWTQVAVKGTSSDVYKSKSLVLGIDLQEVEPLDGATFLSGLDFSQPDSQEQLMKALRQRKADVVISDMAPNMSGVYDRDHENVTQLCYAALNFVQRTCRAGASLVMKVFDGKDCAKLIKDTRALYEKVVVIRPKATRQPSSEMFYVGMRYRGEKALGQLKEFKYPEYESTLEYESGLEYESSFDNEGLIYTSPIDYDSHEYNSSIDQ